MSELDRQYAERKPWPDQSAPEAISRLSAATLRVTLTLRDTFTPAVRRARLAIERLLRVVARAQRHRSGHRHRGTDGWRLRFAPASSMPLGQRTAWKRRMLRVGPNERRAMRTYERARAMVSAE